MPLAHVFSPPQIRVGATAAHIPLRRQGEIDEIGQAAVFLASPLAAYITGTVLVVDGGQNLPGSGGFQQALMEAMGG